MNLWKKLKIIIIRLPEIFFGYNIMSNIIDCIPLEIWLRITNMSGEINLLLTCILTCTKLFGLFECVDINVPINEREFAMVSIIENNEIDVFKLEHNKLEHKYFGNMTCVRLMALSCEKGNIEIIKYLRSKNIMIQLDGYLDFAASKNQIDVMDYIFNNSKNICPRQLNLLYYNTTNLLKSSINRYSPVQNKN